MDAVAIERDCVFCHEVNQAGASTCADCGAPLPLDTHDHHQPSAVELAEEVHVVKDCECGGNWQCTRCVIYLLDNNLPLEGPR